MNERDLVNAELARLYELLFLLMEVENSDTTWVKSKIDFLYNTWLKEVRKNSKGYLFNMKKLEAIRDQLAEDYSYDEWRQLAYKSGWEAAIEQAKPLIEALEALANEKKYIPIERVWINGFSKQALTRFTNEEIDFLVDKNWSERYGEEE